MCLFLRIYFEHLRVHLQKRPVVVTKLNRACSLAVVLNSYLLFVFLANLQEAHVDKRFKKNLTLHFVDSDRQFFSDAIFADDLNDFSFVFEFLAFILDLGSGGQTRCDFRLHGVYDFEVRVLRFLEAYPLG